MPRVACVHKSKSCSPWLSWRPAQEPRGGPLTPSRAHRGRAWEARRMDTAGWAHAFQRCPSRPSLPVFRTWLGRDIPGRLAGHHCFATHYKYMMCRGDCRAHACHGVHDLLTRATTAVAPVEKTDAEHVLTSLPACVRPRHPRGAC